MNQEEENYTLDMDAEMKKGVVEESNSPQDIGEDEEMDVANMSVLSPMGYSDNSCGYCGDRSGSYSYYASAPRLTAQFYQDLISRGWRRSGTTLYKPDLRHSCCPQYTIRLDSTAFSPSKDHRQTLNRFNRYVLGERYIRELSRKHPKSKEVKRAYKQQFDFTERIHESEFAFQPISALNVQSKSNGQAKKDRKEKDVTKVGPLRPEFEYEVTLESDSFTEEKFKLFENYQRIVHHEPPHRISRSGFKSFLCTSPIVRSSASASTKSDSGSSSRLVLGTYHQMHRLNGRLVAISVLDILPDAISAVYFMYDESIHNWSPGKLSALRECALVKELGKRWYMMGFYIHSCVKMRYKGDFGMQEMLDPEWAGDDQDTTGRWWKLDKQMKARLDRQKFTIPSQPETQTSTPTLTETGTAKPTATTSKSIPKPNSLDSSSDSSNSGSTSPTAKPLHTLNMPGILSKQALQTLPLRSTKLRLRDGNIYEIPWIPAALDDPDETLVGVIGDLVSAIGGGLSRRMIIGLGSCVVDVFEDGVEWIIVLELVKD